MSQHAFYDVLNNKFIKKSRISFNDNLPKFLSSFFTTYIYISVHKQPYHDFPMRTILQNYSTYNGHYFKSFSNFTLSRWIVKHQVLVRWKTRCSSSLPCVCTLDITCGSTDASSMNWTSSFVLERRALETKAFKHGFMEPNQSL